MKTLEELLNPEQECFKETEVQSRKLGRKIGSARKTAKNS